MQIEEEKREHDQKMKKMEAEMEQVFEMKVKEKKQKLKDSENDVSNKTRLTIRIELIYNFFQHSRKHNFEVTNKSCLSVYICVGAKIYDGTKIILFYLHYSYKDEQSK